MLVLRSSDPSRNSRPEADAGTIEVAFALLDETRFMVSSDMLTSITHASKP